MLVASGHLFILPCCVETCQISPSVHRFRVGSGTSLLQFHLRWDYLWAALLLLEDVMNSGRLVHTHSSACLTIEKRYEPPRAADFRHLWVHRLPRRYRALGNGRHDYERGKTGPQKIKGMRCHSIVLLCKVSSEEEIITL
jgi:hypothetical protein